MRTVPFLFFITLLRLLPIPAQSVVDIPLPERVSLALSNPHYLVTPGDRYQILYSIQGSLHSLDCVVGPDYKVSLGMFGSLEVKNTNLSELRSRIEEMFRSVDPTIRPIIELKSPGLFLVHLEGEVLEEGPVIAWGLTRLSDIVRNRITSFASQRDIQVIDTEGNARTCDLFLAKRAGRTDQDPYVKAGDRIRVHRLGKEVTLSGEVRRPGIYQLLPSDRLAQLIELYGDGLTPLADRTQILIERPVSPASPLGEAHYITVPDLERWPDIELRHLDRVTIPSMLEKRAVVFFEGAVSLKSGGSIPSSEYEVTNQLRYSITPGTRLSTAIRSLKEHFTQVSDLSKAYIRRSTKEGELRIPVNIEDLLLMREGVKDVELLNGDFVIIPFRQYFVTVSGAVQNPGRYPYVPDRTWRYYVNLAGGIDKSRNAREALEITSKDERKKEKDEFIEPEDKIYVETNDFVYNLSRTLNLIGNIASVVTMVLGVIVIFGF